MNSVISRFKISTQIGTLVLLSALGMTAIGVSFYISSQREAQLEAIASAAVSDTEHGDELQLAMLQARRAEKDFQLRRTMEQLSRHAESIKTVESRLSALAASPYLPDGQRRVVAIRRTLDGYVGAFRKLSEVQIAIGLTENDGLQGTLRSAVRAVEAMIKDENAPRLTILMLSMRRSEKDFLARTDPRHLDEVKQLGTAFARELASSAIDPAEQAEISAKMATYQADLAKLAAAVLALKDANKLVSDAYAEFEPTLVDLAEAIDRQHEATKAELAAGKARFSTVMWSTILGGILVFALFGTIIARGISRPIVRMTDSMQALAEGDRSVEIPGVGRGDEIGAMSAAMEVFKRNAAEADRLAAEQAAEQQRKVEEAHRLAALVKSFNGAAAASIGALKGAAGNMERSAGELAGMAQQSRDETSAVMVATHETSSNVQTVAAASEEMAAALGEISRQVGHSTEVARAAVARAGETNASMRQLADQARTIGDVVQLINSIASQTNLLALNATIEAARAGEAGKGFAVVASEVKNLASQTAKATEEISQQIASMQAASDGAVQAITSITSTIAEINQVATAIAAAVEEQDAATREINRNVQQAAVGTQRIADSLSSVEDAARGTDRSASEVLETSRMLSRQSDSFAREIESFIRGVEAA